MVKIKAGTIIRHGKYSDVYVGRFLSKAGEEHALVFNHKERCAMCFRVGHDGYKSYIKGNLLLSKCSKNDFLLVCENDIEPKSYHVMGADYYCECFLQVSKEERADWYDRHYIVDVLTNANYAKEAQKEFERRYNVGIQTLHRA